MKEPKLQGRGKEGRDSLVGVESLHWEKVRVKMNLGKNVKGLTFQTNANFRLF